MKTILFFDTETDGMVDFKAPSTAHHQPHLVQLAAMLTDENGRVLRAISQIVRPTRWVIPDEIAKIHGITTDIALAYGCRLQESVEWFRNSLDDCDMVVAHNIKFDRIVMDVASYNYSGIKSFNYKEKEIYDTMAEGTNLCKLPGRYGKFKWPKLVELHKFLFGKEFDGAHDALEDVRATMRCYFKMKEMGK